MSLDVASSPSQSLHFTDGTPAGFLKETTAAAAPVLSPPRVGAMTVSLSPQQDKSKSWFGLLNRSASFGYPPMPEPVSVAKDEMC